MNKELKEIAARITEIEKEVSEVSERKEIAERRLEESQETFGVLWDQMKEKALRGEEKSLSALEESLEDHRTGVQRDQATIEAALEALARLETERAGLEKRRTEVFKSLSSSWLKKEIRAYDEAAESLMSRKKRLLAAFHHLRDVGADSVYSDTLGEGYRYLPSLKVPSLSGFNRDAYLNNGSFSGDISEQVYQEITGGK